MREAKPVSDDRLGELEDWIERAEEALDRLEDHVDAKELGPTLETLQDLVGVADEAEDVLDEVDLTELPSAVEGDELLEAIEVGDIPDAVSEGEASEMIDLRALMKAVQLRNLWNSVDVTELLDERGELAEELDEFTDEHESGGIMETIEGAVGDDDSSGAGSGMKQAVESAVTSDEDEESEDERAPVDIPSQEYQEMIQTKAVVAVEEFREGVKEAHKKLKQFREKNREKMRRQHDETRAESRNPTAYSSLPTQRPDIEGNATRHSTVGKTVRHSTAPSFDRVYGDRYDEE